MQHTQEGYWLSLLFASYTQGKPKVLSHGHVDSVIAFESTKLQIVPRMVGAGYDVTFVEFNGNHGIPGSIARQSFEWLLAWPKPGTSEEPLVPAR